MSLSTFLRYIGKHSHRDFRGASMYILVGEMTFCHFFFPSIFRFILFLLLIELHSSKQFIASARKSQTVLASLPRVFQSTYVTILVTYCIWFLFMILVFISQLVLYISVPISEAVPVHGMTWLVGTSDLVNRADKAMDKLLY